MDLRPRSESSTHLRTHWRHNSWIYPLGNWKLLVGKSVVSTLESEKRKIQSERCLIIESRRNLPKWKWSVSWIVAIRRHARIRVRASDGTFQPRPRKASFASFTIPTIWAPSAGEGAAETWRKFERLCLKVQCVQFGLISDFFILVKAQHAARKCMNKGVYQ